MKKSLGREKITELSEILYQSIKYGLDHRAAHDSDFPPPHDPLRPKRLFIALSHREHERIAIAAVKTGLSRHELVRDALESYLDAVLGVGPDLRDRIAAKLCG